MEHARGERRIHPRRLEHLAEVLDATGPPGSHQRYVAEGTHGGELLEVATVFHTKVVDMSPETVILEATSSPGKLDSLLENLERYGTCELVRTGRIAMSRGSATITDNDLAPLAEAV